MSSCVSEHIQHMYALANRSYRRTTLKALDVLSDIDTLDTIAAEEYEG